MKFYKKIFLLLLILLLLISPLCYSNTLSSTNDESVTQESKEVSNDLYIQDSSVNIDYSINGNVFILANDVTISSHINGSVFIFANTVNIQSTGYINASSFICAKKINITGDVFDLYSISDSLELSPDARILRNTTASGNSLNLFGKVLKNANLNFKNINTSNSTLIKENLNYISNSENITKDMVEGNYSFKIKNNFLSKNLLKIVVISTITILIIILKISKLADKETIVLKNKIFQAIAYGSVSLIAIPIICFILLCTIVGILPGLSILFAYLFFIKYLSYAIIAIAISRIISSKLKKNKYFDILLSIILVVILRLLIKIPVLGNILLLLITILALGISTYLIFHPNIKANTKKLVEK